MNFKSRFAQALSFRGISPSKILLPLSILIIGILLTLQQYFTDKQQSKETLEARFNTYFIEVSHHVTEKIEAYEQMLRATQGLFYASRDVSRQEFRAFTQQLQIDVFYPGLQGLGYAPIIKTADRESHIKSVRENGFPNYDMHPEGERDFYTSILYLEPFVDRNIRAFGYDMASEANRRDAMLRARDTQEVALSAGVKLVQDLSGETAVGLLMYQPLFKKSTILGGDSTQYVQSHTGWVYAVFRIDDVVENTLLNSSYEVPFKVTDITGGNRQLLYASSEAFDNDLTLSYSVKLGGRLWQFEAQPSEEFIHKYQPERSYQDLIVGFFLSVLMSLVFWLVINSRLRAERRAMQMTRKLREQNQRLSLATTTARMGIWDWDFVEEKVSLDGSLPKLMLGETDKKHVISTASWLAKIEPSERPRLLKSLDDCIANNQDLNIDVLLQTPNDEDTRMVQFSGALRFDNAGQAVGMLGVSFDITDSWFSQQQLTLAEARWKHALEGSGEGVWDWSTSDDKVIYSSMWVDMLGFETGELQQHLDEWTDRIHPADRADFFAALDSMLDGSKPDLRIEHRLRCKGGSWKWVMCRGTVIERDADNNPLRAVGTISDITWRKEAEITLQMSEERFRNAFDTAAIGMALVDLDGRWLEVNDALCNMLGYSESEVLKLTFMDVTHPDDLDLDQQYVEKLIDSELDHYQMEKRYICKDGQILDALLSVSVVHDEHGKVKHFVSQMQDITARKNERERMRLMAFYDALTGLPNRRLFDERISHAVLSARRNQNCLALMYIDVDHFKQINDSYGHDIGDEVIKTVAKLMHNELRASDTLARFGGDEFVVLLTDVMDKDSVMKVAENLRAPFSEPLTIGEQNIRVTLSIGIAIWSAETDENIASFMKKADIALYEVKAKGRNDVAIYQSSEVD
ncbi:CHASE domain-containing protein [Methylophaga sp. OBS3]|uniref:sensor domain-containing diguanylate cyclase n=1 Tax=Methylophaga sp. OBS3 TaxID=2991934 RepID=UPI002257A1CA|nr:CHASE domain-containing protein [Methylophaga sp. OBS3]MCX4188869.1 diguanylate cyclase [Methylophaga sp. OBS3]